MLYADTSALTKLIIDERESDALRAYLLNREPLVSSSLVTTELIRTVRRVRPDREPQARTLLEETDLILMGAEVLARAATFDPPELRSLDAIHLASALSLGSDLEGILTYDSRMRSAALAMGLAVLSPD